LEQIVTRAEIERQAVIVMGVSGSGKSTLGTLLSRALDCPFLEGDDYHDAAAIEKMRNGIPLTDADRWPWLDRLGHAIDAAVAAEGIAVAACSALRRTYRTRLRDAIAVPTRFLLLDNSREEILQRLVSRPGHYMPASLLDSQFATLERPGADEPATALLTDASPDRLCATALDWIRSPVVSAG
jgi:gluconokinase